jgi:hypothetical protein
MAMIVFFRTPDGPKPASEFISSVPERFRDPLRAFERELRDSGRITQGRSGQVSGGDWSVWIEDEQGERHNFLLYISELEGEGKKRDLSSSQMRELGRWEYGPGRPGDNLCWVEASAFIREKFAGRVREQLLERLGRASAGLPLFDGSIEFSGNKVILRAPAKDVQVKLFDAEVEFEWGGGSGA